MGLEGLVQTKRSVRYIRSEAMMIATKQMLVGERFD